MKTVIVRDDDVGFFTRPSQLDAIYGPLWERNIPVCFAVIPAQHSNVRIAYRPGNPFDPGIPPNYRGSEATHSMLENREICDYLDEKVQDGLVEICLHGLHHTFLEFLIDDPELIDTKIEQGLEILGEAFPSAKVETFIAPYDRVSATALDHIRNAGFNLCTRTENLAHTKDFAHMQGYTQAKFSNNSTLYTCDEYLFNHRDNASEIYATAVDRYNNNDLLIMANHYWSFFHDWQEQGGDLLDHWHQFIKFLMQQNDIIFDTFGKNASN